MAGIAALPGTGAGRVMFNGRWLSIFESRHEPGSGAPLAGAFRSKRGARREAGAVPRIH
jgi:hypothetical protein